MKLTTGKSKTVEILDTNQLGEGGEAVVYKFKLGKDTFAAKIYKTDDHPDYEKNLIEQEKARQRLEDLEVNLKQFPKGLPDNVAAPIDLLYDTSGPRGFYLPIVPDPRDPYRKLCDPNFRVSLDNNLIFDSLIALYQTMHACHTNPQGKLILGDFNDLNVLGLKPWIIDAEAGSYGSKVCITFTQRFTDPTKCKMTVKDDQGKEVPATRIILGRPHDEGSDRYAWVSMLFQSLFLVSQYEGVYKPKDKSKKCPQDARPLYRRTVMADGAKWPKWVQNLGYTPDVYPDDVMHLFHRYFHEDDRSEIDLSIIQNMRWTKCTACGKGHARSQCPNCAAPGVTRATTEVKGKVTCERIFHTDGMIIISAYQHGLKYLIYENGKLSRENGQIIWNGALDPHIRYRLNGDNTCLAKGNMITFEKNGSQNKTNIDTYGVLPIFDANQDNRFWLNGGRLQSNKMVGRIEAGERNIGQVLRNQTLFWVGDSFGFGFYRASNLSEFFVFGAKEGILKDGIKVPPLKGQLLDSTCSFSSSHCWFFATYDFGGTTKHRCSLLDQNGTVLGSIEEDAGSDSWLGRGIRGTCAVGNMLFVPTDDGLVRVKCDSGLFNTASFPDTEPFIDASCQVLQGDKCLHVVSRQDIHKIVMN